MRRTGSGDFPSAEELSPANSAETGEKRGQTEGAVSEKAYLWSFPFKKIAGRVWTEEMCLVTEDNPPENPLYTPRIQDNKTSLNKYNANSIL